MWAQRITGLSLILFMELKGVIAAQKSSSENVNKNSGYSYAGGQGPKSYPLSSSSFYNLNGDNYNNNGNGMMMGLQMEPSFVGHVKNITVAQGRNVALDCQVKNVMEYKVGWLKNLDQTVLTIHKTVVTQNPRIRVTHDEHQTWTLKILEVTDEDQGCYMCQINTRKMKMQVGCITVLVPPDIKSEDASPDVTVNEHHPVDLRCKATGQPTPVITWRRHDKRPFVVREGRLKKKVTEYKGEILPLAKVRRADMGNFMCIASNDVPPAIAKTVVLNVNFPPSIRVLDQLIGCPSGKTVRVTCTVEAYPEPITYWMRSTANGKQDMLLPKQSSQFNVRENFESSFRRTIELEIKSFTSEDAGHYTCISHNSLGREEGKIRLYEIKREVPEPKYESVITTEPPTFETSTSSLSRSKAGHEMSDTPTKRQTGFSHQDVYDQKKLGQHQQQQQQKLFPFRSSASEYHKISSSRPHSIILIVSSVLLSFKLSSLSSYFCC